MKEDYFDAWLSIGVVQCRLLLYEQSEASLNRAIQLNQDSHIAWSHQCITLQNLGKYKEALSSIDKAIKIKHDDCYYWTVRGTTLNNLKRYEDAIYSLNKALAIEPNYNLALQAINDVKTLSRRSTFSGRLRDAHKIFLNKYKVIWIGISVIIVIMFWNTIINNSFSLFIISVVILFLIIDFSIEIIFPR